MISYPVSWRALSARVEQSHPRWHPRARMLTEVNRLAGKHVDYETSHWRVVKYELMAIQFGKCAWCERRIEGVVEADVDHVRPKQVYFLLAYRLENYVVGCKTCNSGLKLTTFPLSSGVAAVGLAEVEAVENAERAVLPVPIYSGFGDRPETLLTFDGILAVPSSDDPLKRSRAQETIQLFALNTRETLWKERAAAILDVWGAWQAHTSKQNGCSVSILRSRILGSQPHASCRRAFLRACLVDADRARRIATLCERYIEQGASHFFADTTQYRVT